MDSGHHSPYCASPISPIRFISLDGNSEFCFKIPSPCSHDCDTVFSFSEMETSSVDHFSTPSSPRPVSAKCAMDVLPENPSADINQLKDGPRLKRFLLMYLSKIENPLDLQPRVVMFDVLCLLQTMEDIYTSVETIFMSSNGR